MKLSVCDAKISTDINTNQLTHSPCLDTSLVVLQVAEMHGELMEFNELLHRQINVKESMLKKLRQELVDLRGPVRS